MNVPAGSPSDGSPFSGGGAIEWAYGCPKSRRVALGPAPAPHRVNRRPLNRTAYSTQSLVAVAAIQALTTLPKSVSVVMAVSENMLGVHPLSVTQAVQLAP
jgi:hypothetical protein